MSRPRPNEGFTLIEMLVVVIIIATLASISTPQYFKVVESARISEASFLLSTIRNGQEGVLASAGAYMHSNAELPALDVELPGEDPTYGMKYFFMVVGEGSPDGCPPNGAYYNIAFIRYGENAKVMRRYFENYMMVYERCTNQITFPGCPNCANDFKR
ncbi:MAG: prepilin-type N-terminal cleavage/methylation domain-containing protein [Elusimicrobiota bacterium]